MEVLGCRMYYNTLLEGIGIPLVGECTIRGVARDRGEAYKVAGEALKVLNSITGIKAEISYAGNELIGRRYTVYRHSLLVNGSVEGEIRVVADRDGTLFNVSAVATGTAAKTLGLEVGPGWSVSTGFNMEPVFMPESGDGGWPSGQKSIPRFVIYAAEGIPWLDVESWRLEVKGRLGSITLSYSDLLEESNSLGGMDFHCVTGWSVKGRSWSGVPLRRLLSRVDNLEPGWVVFESVNGYSTIVPIGYAVAEDAFIITGMDGRPLSRENGFPARFFNPRLFGWKSAKWLGRITVTSSYIDGLWEALAYHERGLVASDERFKVRNPDLA